MTPTKILIGQALVVFAMIIGTLWYATQWVADSLHHHPRLGLAWFHIAQYPVYYPWRLFEWWYVFEAYAPHIFHRGGVIAASGGALGALAAIIGSVWRARQSQIVTTYGSARWATEKDIRSAGLLDKKGTLLGKWKGHYLRHDGPEHVMAFAPTRSGKGVGLVVPSLLSWTGSAVIHDIKGENWQLTAGWRSRFSHCLLFNPTDPRSAKYNPLLEVRKGAHEVRDVQNIADILVDPEGSLERRSHWEKTGHALLVGTILHVLYAERDKSLAGVASFLSDPSRTFERTLFAMMTTNHVGSEDFPVVHPVVSQCARELLNKSENERSGVLSTALSFLSLYRDPTVAAVTCSCDWMIADLVDAKRPVSLYLVVPPSDISRTKPLIRLVLNQIGRRLTERLEGDPGTRRHKLLMMLDEFPALGRLDFFESALAFMAGYGIRAYLIAQSLNQIEKAYGPNNSILDNCHVRIAFATNDERTARRISDSLGTTTELRAQRNYAGHRLAPWLAHVMVSRQETMRPLLTPGEVMQLPSAEEIVMVAGLPPIQGEKLRYFMDENFTNRCLSSPELLSDAPYSDRPKARDHNWKDIVKAMDRQLVRAHTKLIHQAEEEAAGLERHPSLALEKSEDPDALKPEMTTEEDDFDASDSEQMDALVSTSIRRAHAMDLADDDLLPDF